MAEIKDGKPETHTPLVLFMPRLHGPNQWFSRILRQRSRVPPGTPSEGANTSLEGRKKRARNDTLTDRTCQWICGGFKLCNLNYVIVIMTQQQRDRQTETERAHNLNT